MIKSVPKVLFIGLALAFIACSEKTSSPALPDEPLVMRLVSTTSHFKYFYDGSDVGRIQTVINALERNYDRIISDLGPIDMAVVNVKIWAEESDWYSVMQTDLGKIFQGATGYAWDDKELRILLTSRSPMVSVHEFVHCASLALNKSIANNPRWLWETVAVYESDDFVPPGTLAYMQNGNYPTLDMMNGGFGAGIPYVYDVGFILGEYIVEKWGNQGLRNLVLHNGALGQVLNLSAAEFESGWFAWIKNKYFSE